MKFFLKQFGKILQEIPLEEGKEYFVGRHEECDIVLENAAGLSRKHLKIYQSPESGNWTVELISELGGLCLDGEELEGVELEESATLSLRNYVLEFLKEEPAPESSEDQQREAPSPAKEQTNLDQGADGKTKVFNPSEFIYSLHIYIDGEISDHVNLNEENSWLIGRSEECDISIDYSVLTRKHLKITRDKENFYVEDLGSANKTFLNGKDIPPHKPIGLKANDQISVSDLKIIFEVRSRSFNEMMSKLPAVVSQDVDEEENLPELPFPKVILEDISEEEEEEKKIDKSALLKEKKYFIVLIGVFVLGGILYFQYEADRKEKKLLAERQKQMEEKQKLELLFQEAWKSREEKKYSICKEQLEDLHRSSPEGFDDGASNSYTLLESCERSLNFQKQKEEMAAREEEERKTKEKIKRIAEKCRKEYQEKKIKTVEDLNFCAQELVDGLDPANPIISNIRNEIVEAHNLQLLQEQKRADYRRFIQGKKALYNKAKKKAQQNKALEAVAAYNIFLKAARGVSALKKLSDQALKERDTIQQNYDGELSRLHQSCENLIQRNQMKEAYSDCKKVLLFKEDDKKAKKYIETAKNTLRKKFKPLYEQSMMDESFSRIEEAKKIWNEILEKDIKEGYYYRKALAQLKKYK